MGCSLECYRVRVGIFNQKVPKVKTMKSTPNVRKTVRVKQVARSLICWCLVFLLVSLISSLCQEASSPASLRQTISILPAHTNRNHVIEHKKLSFIYPYLKATKVQNKEVHTKNGNLAICICYWNKGSSYLINKKGGYKGNHKYTEVSCLSSLNVYSPPMNSCNMVFNICISSSHLSHIINSLLGVGLLLLCLMESMKIKTEKFL